MTQLQYLALGFGLVWILLAFYIAGLHRRLHRMRREVVALSRGIEERKRSPETGAAAD